MRQLLVVIATSLALLACSGAGEDVGSTAAPSSPAAPTSGASVVPTVPSIRPVPLRAPATPVTQVGATRPLVVTSSQVRWEPYDATRVSEANAWAWQKVYAVDRDELWTTVGPGDRPYRLALSPDDDRGVGAVNDSYANRDLPTVLVDLASGEVRDLFPFPVEVRHWIGLDQIVIKISQGAAAPPRSVGWTAGIYELDLAKAIATLISTARYYRPEVPVPAGSALAAGVIEWRVNPEAGSSALVLRDDDAGTERIVADELGNVSWAPDWQYAVLVGREGELSVLDPSRAEVFGLDALGLGRPHTITWSPDGRYFVPERTDPTIIVDTDGLDASFSVEALRLVGPFEAAIFADWGPGALPGEALLLGEYCAPDGFWLDRVNLETGDVRRIPTAEAEFWVYDWSPRGDLVAVSSWKVDTGFTLVDAVTGERQSRPNLEATVTTMQDVQWSASGQWIALQQISGRDRCMV